MSGPVNRYKFYYDHNADHNSDMILSDSGSWVEYSEYKMLLDKYEAVLKRIEDESKWRVYDEWGAGH